MPAPHHSGFYRISQYFKGKTSLDLNEASNDTVFGWQLDHMQTICTLLQTTTPTPHHSIFTGRVLFLTPNQQCQSTEGNKIVTVIVTHTFNGPLSGTTRVSRYRKGKNQSGFS